MTMTPATRLTRPRWWPDVAAWVPWALTMLSILVIAWLDQLSRHAGPNWPQLTPNALVGPVLAAVSAITVGAVLASRRPGHPSVAVVIPVPRKLQERWVEIVGTR